MDKDNEKKYIKERPTFPKRAIVTFGMPYGNKELHFGHLFGMVICADFYARFLRNRIGSENVILQSGTDAYGSTMALTFEQYKEKGRDFGTMLDMIKFMHNANVETMKKAEISFNFFGASAFGEAKEEHEKVSAEFFEAMYKTGNLIKMDTEQFFDEEVGQFLNGRQVVGKCPYVGCPSEKAYADECDFCHQYLPKQLINPISILSHKPPVLKKITNWYFDITKYNKLLLELVEKQEKDSRNRKYMLKEIKEFLKKPEVYIKQEYYNNFIALKEQLPKFEIVDENSNKPSFTIIFETLAEREKACEILNAKDIKFRNGKTLVPFRITGDYYWGVPAPEKDGLKNLTFYVWPESLWAPISFTRAYLKTATNVASKNYEDWWENRDCIVYQFLGEDNMYFYGPPQQAMYLATQGKNPTIDAKNGMLPMTQLIPNKHSLYMGLKASSSGKYKAPLARELFDYYTIDQLRMHFLAMGYGETNVNITLKAFNPDAKPDEVDVALKEGNILINVYNRILRHFSIYINDAFNGELQLGEARDEIKELCKKAMLDYEERAYNYKFHVIINIIDGFMRNINKIFDKDSKQAIESGDVAQKQQVAIDGLYMIKVVNMLLNPIVPSGSERVAQYFNFNDKWTSWNYAFDNVSTFVQRGTKIEKLEDENPFFKKHPTQN